NTMPDVSAVGSIGRPGPSCGQSTTSPTIVASSAGTSSAARMRRTCRDARGTGPWEWPVTAGTSAVVSTVASSAGSRASSVRFSVTRPILADGPPLPPEVLPLGDAGGAPVDEVVQPRAEDDDPGEDEVHRLEAGLAEQQPEEDG